MDKKRAIEILTILTKRYADCHCGNYDLTDDEIRAINLIIQEESKTEK